MGENTRGFFFFPLVGVQGLKACLEVRLLLGNRGGDIGEVGRSCGGDQSGGCRHQGAGLACHTEGGGHFRDAVLVDPGLGIARLIERKPGHQACRQGDYDGSADPDVELYSEPDSAFTQPLRQLHRQTAMALNPLGPEQAGQWSQDGGQESALEQSLQQAGNGGSHGLAD